MTAFLTTCLNALAASMPPENRSPELVLTIGTMNSISLWMLRLEGAGRYLSEADANWFWEEGNRFLG